MLKCKHDMNNNSSQQTIYTDLGLTINLLILAMTIIQLILLSVLLSNEDSSVGR